MLIEYFKLQAENLLKDFETKKSHFDSLANAFVCQYNPNYFDVDAIISDFEIDEDNFNLQEAKNVIAFMAGFEFNGWEGLSEASELELEMAKLLFDNQDKINTDDWWSLILDAEEANGSVLDTSDQINFFKFLFLREDSPLKNLDEPLQGTSYLLNNNKIIPEA